MVFPPIHWFMGLGGIDELLQFIQDRLKASEWFQVSGSIDAATNTIEYVPANGKTAVLFEAKVIIDVNGTASAAVGVTETDEDREQVVAQIKVDSTVKDTTQVGHASKAKSDFGTAKEGRGSGSGFGHAGDGHFNALGISLAGDGAKKITIENITDNATSVYATMSGWIYTT